MRFSIISPHLSTNILSLLLRASTICGSTSELRSGADVGVVFSCCCRKPLMVVETGIKG